MYIFDNTVYISRHVEEKMQKLWNLVNMQHRPLYISRYLEEEMTALYIHLGMWRKRCRSFGT
jgi:hypothetical protein